MQEIVCLYELSHIHVIEYEMVPMRLVTKTVLLVVIFRLLVSSSHADDLHYISNSCLKTNNSYSLGSVFQANLNITLLTQFPAKASVVGFSNFSMGTGVDQVYALYYCRGDVDAEICQYCVQAAAEKILQVCKFMKEAIIWFEECTLRYANQTIFSIDAENPSFLYSNNTSIVSSYRLDPYQQIFDSTMEALIRQAAYTNGFLKGFAVKEVNLSSSEELRGLAQCTPDIIGPPCYKCLTSAIKQRDSWTNTMIFLPSCLIRYDLYGSPLVYTLSPKKGQRIVAIIGVPVVILILIVGFCFWKRPCRRGFRIFKQKHSRGLRDFKFSQLQKLTNGLSDKLGEGGYGEVYRGHLEDGRVVAVKVLSKKDATAQFDTEMAVFESISHKNLVKLIGYCKERNHLALVYEYMPGGDLRKLLSECANLLSWSKRLEIAIDVAEGLRYLHDNCDPAIVHRDMKPANVLLNDKHQAKVADFGISKIFPNEIVTTVETKIIYTPGYAAPEYFATGLLNKNVDVYSFGVVLLELITGRTPSNFFNLVEWVDETIKEGDTGKLLDERLTTEANHESVWNAVQLARSCTNVEATDRPEMFEIIIKLNQCKKMELENGVGGSSTGSTPIETRITVVSEAR